MVDFKTFVDGDIDNINESRRLNQNQYQHRLLKLEKKYKHLKTNDYVNKLDTIFKLILLNSSLKLKP